MTLDIIAEQLNSLSCNNVEIRNSNIRFEYESSILLVEYDINKDPSFFRMYIMLQITDLTEESVEKLKNTLLKNNLTRKLVKFSYNKDSEEANGSYIITLSIDQIIYSDLSEEELNKLLYTMIEFLTVNRNYLSNELLS